MKFKVNKVIGYNAICRHLGRTNAVLMAIVCVLLALCVASVYSPIRFEKQRAAREDIVKRRLVLVRKAAEAYRHDHGAYTGRLQALADSGYIADSLLYIPYSGGRRFHLEASAVTTRSGRTVSVMECSATYDEYLRGLDADAVRALAADAGNAGRFPGLKIGDITTPGDNNGNWE